MTSSICAFIRAKLTFSLDSELFHSITNVLVGPEKQRFLVPKDMLCRTSNFFQASLDGGFKESSSNTCYLPEVSPKTFALLIKWLYSRTFEHLDAWPNLSPHVTPEEENDNDSDDESAPEKDCQDSDMDLCRLYVLADILEMPILQNAIVDQLQYYFKTENTYPHCRMVTHIYSNTTKAALIRKYFVAYHVWLLDDCWALKSNYYKLYPKGFLAAVGRETRRRYAEHPSSPFYTNLCGFHVHTEGESCETKKYNKAKNESVEGTSDLQG